MKPGLLSLGVIAVAAFAAIGSGCTDPVRDAQIEALGDEQGTPNADHRPGQPCLLCHSEGGPASSKPFAIAGTIYETKAHDSEGAEEIIVQFRDARGGEPLVPATTGPSGNFYVPLGDWPNIAFPIRTALYKDNINTTPIKVMKSLINREGSCNFCHKPNIDKDDLPEDEDELKKALQKTTESAGQISVQ